MKLRIHISRIHGVSHTLVMKVKRNDLILLTFCKSYLKAMTPTNIQAACKKTGVFQTDENIEPQEKQLPANLPTPSPTK